MRRWRAQDLPGPHRDQRVSPPVRAGHDGEVAKDEELSRTAGRAP
jgi:hypothetical protein